MTEDSDVTSTLDCVGLFCPEPLFQTRQGIDAIEVSGGILEKGLIYANCWLTAPQADMYRKFHDQLIEDCVRPALVIYLHDTIQSCLDRIHKRNRPYEQKIEPEFLETLNSGYENIFADWKKSPVIHLDVAEFNCLSQLDVENLANEVKNYIAV